MNNFYELNKKFKHFFKRFSLHFICSLRRPHKKAFMQEPPQKNFVNRPFEPPMDEHRKFLSVLQLAHHKVPQLPLLLTQRACRPSSSRSHEEVTIQL